jgi:hypothetical protein
MEKDFNKRGIFHMFILELFDESVVDFNRCFCNEVRDCRHVIGFDDLKCMLFVDII